MPAEPDDLVARARRAVESRQAAMRYGSGAPQAPQTSRVGQMEADRDPTEFARYLDPQKRGFSEDELSRFPSTNHAIFANPVGYAQRVASAYLSLPSHHRAAMASDYAKVMEAVDAMTALKSLAEIGDLPAATSGLAHGVGNLFGVLPKWGENVERWFGLEAEWEYDAVDPRTGQVQRVQRGKMPVSQIMAHAASAVNGLEKFGVGDAVEPRLRDMLKEHFGALQISSTARVIAELGGTGKVAKGLASALAPSKGIAGKAVGAVADLVAGTRGGAATVNTGVRNLAHMAALGGAHGAAGGVVAATIGGRYEDHLRAELDKAPLEEVAKYGGDYELYAKERASQFFPRMAFALSEAGSEAARGSVAFLGWGVGTGIFNKITGAGARAIGPSWARGEQVLAEAGAKAMSTWRPFAQKLLDSSQRGSFAAAIAEGMKQAPAWLFGTKGSELASQLAFGAMPEALDELSHDWRITAALGFAFGAGSSAMRHVRSGPAGAAGGGITPQQAVDRDIARGDILASALKLGRERGVPDAELVNVAQRFRSQDAPSTELYAKFLKSGMRSRDWALLQREMRSEWATFLKRREVLELPAGRDLQVVPQAAGPEAPAEMAATPAPERKLLPSGRDLAVRPSPAEAPAGPRAQEAAPEPPGLVRAPGVWPRQRVVVAREGRAGLPPGTGEEPTPRAPAIELPEGPLPESPREFRTGAAEADIYARSAGFQDAAEFRQWRQDMLGAADSLEVAPGARLHTVEAIREMANDLRAIEAPASPEQSNRVLQLRETLGRALSPEGQVDLFAEEAATAKRTAARQQIESELNALLRQFAVRPGSTDEIAQARKLRAALEKARTEGEAWKPPSGYPKGDYDGRLLRVSPRAEEPGRERQPEPEVEAVEEPVAPSEAPEVGPAPKAAESTPRDALREVGSADYEQFRGRMQELLEAHGRDAMAAEVAAAVAAGEISGPRNKAWATRFLGTGGKKNGRPKKKREKP